MTTALVQKLSGVRDFKKILETAVKELGETYSADISQIAVSNPLDINNTSICDYRLEPDIDPADLLSMTFPLPLQGSGLGMVTLARRSPMTENEINWIRITLAELSEIIRFAQINDVVQRDTFRETFLVEIGNVMNYSLSISDALFMVVNILGKVLNASRCLFICVDDTQAGWKCYEFWQRDKVRSCQDFGWPTKDSPILAQSLLSEAPLIVHEGNPNSYQTPVQEELALLGVRSLLGVALRSEEGTTHGCVILQQCDTRHAWTRGEIDMVQNVADKVAEALNKFPEEKKSREPIMRLHERVVTAPPGADEKESILTVRRNLRGALGQQAIPSAQKGGPPPTPAPATKTQPSAWPTPPVTGPTTAAPSTQTPTPAPSNKSTDAWGVPSTPPQTPANAAPNTVASDAMSALADVIVSEAKATDSKTSSNVGAWGDTAPAPGDNRSVLDKWDNLDLDTIPKTRGKDTPPEEAPAGGGSPWGDLDSIPSPKADKPSAWGNLDAIPTPAGGPGKAGLGSSMFSGRKTTERAAASPLLASLHKDKSKFEAARKTADPPPQFVDGPPIEIDEQQAQAKISQLMSSSANVTSDYIFATPGLNPRLAGRIDGWVTEVEQKDKYDGMHALTVAQYAVGIATLIGLPPQEVDTIRLAALVHDVGKLGLPAGLLRKPEEQLEDTELLMMMKHTIDGATLLEGFPELAHLAPIVLSHHEEFNGQGYPAGLGGEEIPLAARIIHVASAYHGMVFRTVGHEPVSPEQAIVNLRAGAGKAYDPTLVEAFIACLSQGMVPATAG